MLVRMIQKLALYTKEIQDAGLFALMSNSRIYIAFCGSPLYYVMLPFMGVLLTIMAIINGYRLVRASNKNFDQWFSFITSLGCALLGSIALYGLALSFLYEFTFAAGPWFFMSSIALSFVHESVMLGLNIYRAYECLKGSVQRMHYVQAALNHLFMLGLLATVTGAIVFVMISPVAPVVGAAFALTAVGFTLLNIGWRILPHNWKLFIKGMLFLGKPDESILPPEVINNCQLGNTLDIELNTGERYQRLFTQWDYSAEVRVIALERGVEFIQRVITRKIAILHNASLPGSEQNNQKAAFLSEISSALTYQTKMNKSELLGKYPLAFQNFWSEKSEVEQIYDAAKLLIAKYEQQMMAVDAPLEHDPVILGI